MLGRVYFHSPIRAMSDSTSNILGGVIGALQSSQSCRPVHLSEGEYFINARSAIHAIIANRDSRQAWLPSYLCDSVLIPFRQCGIPVRFYPVDASLESSETDWISEVKSSDIVLGINYFGLAPFPHFNRLRDTGACLIEDLSQALFQPRDPDVDFAVYSLRKFLPVIDGGLLTARPPNSLPTPSRDAEDESFFGPAAAAFFGRGLADIGDVEGGDWFGAFRRGEELTPTAPVAMSKASRWILRELIDFKSIEMRRRRNFGILLESLSAFLPLMKIALDRVPLGFPVVVANREELIPTLYASEIFPPIHWPLRHFLPEQFRESHSLADSILTLPCDQRFSVEQMSRLSEIVLKHAKPLSTI